MTTESMIASLERNSRVSAILIALGAVVVAGALWVSTSRLVQVQAEVSGLHTRANDLRARNLDLERAAADLSKRSEVLRSEVAGLRQALSSSRDAIAAFHARDYATAVALYDTALSADPGNAYLMNLKAYSLFKQGRVSEAIAVQQQGLRIDPSFTWGLFDLARFQCAAGDHAAAASALRDAIARDDRFRRLSQVDGEFRRVCGALGR